MSATEAGEPGAATAGEGDAPVGYEGPGAWGTWAMILLVVLFLVATGATVHSILATLV